MSFNLPNLSYPQRLLVLDIINRNRTETGRTPVSEQDLFFDRLEPPADLHSEIAEKLALLASGYPLDYLLSEINFLDLKVKINPGVFIPRQETEEWVKRISEQLIINNEKLETSPVEVVPSPPVASASKLHSEDGCHSELVSVSKKIGNIKKSELNKKPLLIDLCCGSGVIGLSLADYYDQVILMDFSTTALENAELNRRKNSIQNVCILESNLLDNLDLQKLIGSAPNWDLVCNPPYVPTDDLAKTVENKIEHEPEAAIFSGPDGLDFFRSLLVQMTDLPLPEEVWFELDPRNIRQAQVELNKLYRNTEIWLDSANLERVLVGQI